jgi:hypothetical protein
MATTPLAALVFARGQSNAAFAQLSTSAVTTRSGAVATATVTNTTLAVNDYVLVQGHDLEEYNGVFKVESLISTTGITYNIKQDPGASSTTTVMTIDKVTLGTGVDCSTAYDGRIVGGIQNGNSAPGAAPQIWVGESSTSTLADYTWRPLMAGDSVAKSWTPFAHTLRPGWFTNLAICRNTTNAVDVRADSVKITAVV